MPDTEENIDYFKYGDYIQGKNEKNRIINQKKYEIERYNNIITKIQVPTQFLELNDIFNKLHILFSNHNPFLKGFNHNYCMYVNFFLNKIINPLYNEEDKKQYFSFFKKFGTELETIKRTTSTCLSYLHSIKPEVFTKMDLLYDLYDKYSAHVEFKKPQDGPKCNDLRSFRFLYNDIIRKYDGKEKKIIEKLIKLKELVEKNIFSPNKVMCGEQVTYFNEPVKYLEEKKRLETLEEEKQQKLKQQQGKKIEPTEHNPTQTGEETELRVPFLSSNHQVQGDPVRREQSHAHVNTVHPVLPEYTGIREGKTFSFKNELEQNEIDKYETGYPTRGKNEESDYFGKVQGFFTETFRHVEPGPILGVSGGMGALFLLFKYTPVGSFFGGRRGRNLRIPSGFPGAYPGFPEYYDGNFGIMPINISYQAE